MDREALRTKLREEIQAVQAPALLPHHRRGALLMLDPAADLLEVAVAIGADDASQVTQLIESGQLKKPTLAQLADWCVDTECRFQFVIVQPYVVAQPLPRVG